MKIYKSIIIEDENLARKKLKNQLKEFQQIEIIAEADNGILAVQKINQLKPDLIFLDIQMPGLNGFQVLEKLVEIPLVIFTTAYDEFALRAFETNSIDYLLKPISPERLGKAIRKLETLQKNSEQNGDEILQLLKNINVSNKSRIQVKCASKIMFLNLDDILYFKSEEKYSYVYTKKDKFIINESLNVLQEELPNNFKRTHRAYLVNFDFASEIISLSASKSFIRLNDKRNTEIPVSRRMKNKLIQ